MAGNIKGDYTGKILVEFDYNNIIVVDPNKTIDTLGNIQERLVDHENLVMFANLEAELLPRTKLAVGLSPENTGIQTISIAKINFLKPGNKSQLTTEYYDELTGKGSTKGEGINQMRKDTVVGESGQGYQSVSFQSDGSDGTLDTGLLGITSIVVRTNSSFVPSVDIQLEDVQGRALFQLGDQSPYSAFFNLPYPPFYLTLKGYYGQSIKYQLNLEKFNARFNSFSGNYQVTLNFKGYKFNVLNEIAMGHLFATPHMYAKRFEVSQSTPDGTPGNQEVKIDNQGGNAPQSTVSEDVIKTEVVNEKGYQKILEVYTEYKTKGLIPADFPEMTLYQFMQKVDMFEQNVIANYTKADLDRLTYLRNFKTALLRYDSQLVSDKNSWFVKYLDLRPLILKTGQKVYTFKRNFDADAKYAILTKLVGIVTDNNSVIADLNNTLSETPAGPIYNGIKPSIFTANTISSNVNWKETAIQQLGIVNPTNDQISRVENDFSGRLLPVQKEVSNQAKGEEKQFKVEEAIIFIFDGEGRFNNLIRNMEAETTRKLGEAESQITAELAKKLEDKNTGIGFKPTIRNVVAIIMANAEGFIRLLDDVHRSAWEVRLDPVRKNAILNNPSSAPGSDTMNNVKVSETAPINSPIRQSEKPVYPWPQFFVESVEDKKGRFQLKYIADPTVVDLTQGYLYAKWPEVEFVEEYMKGLSMKFNAPVTQPPELSELTTNLLNINAIEFPLSDVVYSNKEEIKFFYEIWERQFLTSYYTGLNRVYGPVLDKLLETVSSYEAQNIVKSLGLSNPYLSLKLKNYDITAANFKSVLQNISNNGTGRAYQDFVRDFFVTPYIRQITENQSSVLALKDIGKIPQNRFDAANLLSAISVTSNDINTLVDTYPFIKNSWNLNNLVSGKENDGLFFNTNRTITVYKERNVISNFDDLLEKNKKRPVTNFSYLNCSAPTLQPTLAVDFWLAFYGLRKPKDFIPTEGYCEYMSPSKGVPFTSTTSMLNTPMFINAIQQGVFNDRRSVKTPYVEAAYLFLNSLPLISTREKVKSTDVPTLNDLDYIFAQFKKFGGVHKLPYAWILKMGSIWHRYKVYIESGVDILNPVWKNYNYTNNFDPISGSTSKNYTLQIGPQDVQNIQLQTTIPSLTASGFMQVGFYPKTINDFNYFYNGYDLYTGYTDQEIQTTINNGLKIYNFENSNLISPVFFEQNIPYSLKTWSCIIPSVVTEEINKDNCTVTISGLNDYYVLPSFGTNTNQAWGALINNSNQDVTTGYTFFDNAQVYNGSVRLLWSAPNYGYFDLLQIKKPEPDEYINQVVQDANNMAPFKLSQTYDKIEEIFGIFGKDVLDKFEAEFLAFSKPETNADLGSETYVIGQLPYDINKSFRNFQALFKNLMRVPAKVSSATDEDYFKNVGLTQFANFKNIIIDFLSYDVLFRFGNPSYYNRRVFDSFLTHRTAGVTGNLQPFVIDPIRFEPYEVGSLPGGGAVTLQQSKIDYAAEWRELELSVGFSTIDELRYKNAGSYITDFFINNNIKFTVENIRILAPLIKIYATQKLINGSINNNDFKQLIQNYLGGCENLQNYVLDSLMNKVRAGLPNQQQLPERAIQSVYDGQQSKVENYEMFKALNDKWISGGDYTNRTLFEDVLFLDRASRNIGDIIYIDIFSLKNTLNREGVNMKMSAYSFISSLIFSNNFYVMNMPAWVNFYNAGDIGADNIIKPEGSTDFANNMWGTFLGVDYRDATPKMVCFFAGRPSNYLELPNNDTYRNDGFELSRASENPLIENQQGKQDWALSNKVVGFNVDIGIRSQNVFFAFSVSQENGKATSESINTQMNFINQYSGRQVATQNNSLYNFYKQRSYQATVSCLGNAVIQPMMYFNLRHVPMFNGPYMILDVEHQIQPGNFQTTFTGVRQGMFDLPSIDKYLQSLNQNLLTQLEKEIKNRKDSGTLPATTEQQKQANKQTGNDSSKSTTNSCTNSVKQIYLNNKFVSVEPRNTDLTPRQLADALNRISTNSYTKAAIYAICYVNNYINGAFKGYNHNYTQIINLKEDFSPTYTPYFEPTYCCINTSTGTVPLANFLDEVDFLTFMNDRITPNTSRIEKIGLWNYYICNLPVNNYLKQETFEKNKNNQQTQQILLRLKEGLVSAKTVGLTVPDIGIFVSGTTSTLPQGGQPNNQNTTTTGGPACPPPVIRSVAPLSANKNIPVTISGSSFFEPVQVTVSGVTAVISNVTKTTITFFPPENVSGPIVVKTKFGQISAPQQISYVANSPSSQVNTNSSDEAAFTNASLNGTILNISYSANTGYLIGDFRITNGVLQKDHAAELYVGVVKICDFVIKNNKAPQRNVGSFVSTTNNWNTYLNSIATGVNRLVTFKVKVPEYNKEFTYTYSVLDYNCPAKNLDRYSLISPTTYQQINVNPCCSCYPGGTNGQSITINGITCDPTGANC